MKQEKIMIIRKEPGKSPELILDFDNTLESFQQAVGGYIETVTFAEDAAVILNEEGRLLGLPYNCKMFGVHFAGTILIVGVDGDEFTSLPADMIPALFPLLR